ncbi:hypothetical protein ACWCPX_13400 [Streptomyces olivaceoviridis]
MKKITLAPAQGMLVVGAGLVVRGGVGNRLQGAVELAQDSTARGAPVGSRARGMWPVWAMPAAQALSRSRTASYQSPPRYAGAVAGTVDRGDGEGMQVGQCRQQEALDLPVPLRTRVKSRAWSMATPAAPARDTTTASSCSSKG